MSFLILFFSLFVISLSASAQWFSQDQQMTLKQKIELTRSIRKQQQKSDFSPVINLEKPPAPTPVVNPVSFERWKVPAVVNPVRFNEKLPAPVVNPVRFNEKLPASVVNPVRFNEKLPASVVNPVRFNEKLPASVVNPVRFNEKLPAPVVNPVRFNEKSPTVLGASSFTPLSVERREVPQQSFPIDTDAENIRMILTLPLKNRNQALRQYKIDSFSQLEQFVFSNKESMQTRWLALISLAYVYREQSRPIIEKALSHQLWFLRNAGLISMEIVDPQESLQWADRLCDDSSLIVRTSAVLLIKRQKADRYKVRLIEKLYAPDSFYRNKSLWIRYHIVSVLADFAKKGEEQFFISILRDGDSRLHPYASKALERLTGKSFDNEKAQQTMAEQKQMWLDWWLEYKKMSVSL